MISDWSSLKALALDLNLPEVEIAYPWGHETLKAHGKHWTYWAALTDAAVFKSDKEERALLWQADPETFFSHPHYDPHNLILVRAGRIDPDWARARLLRTWRDMAPKRVLKTWDAGRAGA
jgi:hypothetical protein